MCENGDCYSIPNKELPNSGTSLGPKYEKYKIGSQATAGFVAPLC